VTRVFVLSHRCGRVRSRAAGLQAFLLHQPNHPPAPDVLVACGQLGVNAGAAVGASASLVHLTDDHRQAAVLTGTFRFWPAAPGVVASARNTQRPAPARDSLDRLLRSDERELHALSFAKKAAAFFRMSRS